MVVDSLLADDNKATKQYYLKKSRCRLSRTDLAYLQADSSPSPKGPVIWRPEIPLHDNPVELQVRQRVQKRKIAFGPLVAEGVDPPAELAEAVHTQTESNPLFVTEVVRLLASTGKQSGAFGIVDRHFPQNEEAALVLAGAFQSRFPGVGIPTGWVYDRAVHAPLVHLLQQIVDRVGRYLSMVGQVNHPPCPS